MPTYPKHSSKPRSDSLATTAKNVHAASSCIRILSAFYLMSSLLEGLVRRAGRICLNLYQLHALRCGEAKLFSVVLSSFMTHHYFLEKVIFNVAATT